MTNTELKALTPRKRGHQFAFYGDSCSGVPGALHAQKLAKINAVVQRLAPAPEFIIFPGDEIIGLTPSEADLVLQWKYFFDVEMAWLKKTGIPMYHATGNHTTYDAMSERVFADVMAHLPRNGPVGQEGLSYFIRNGDLLLVFVHTLWSELGGEGHVELEWLSDTLETHQDARWKFVVGHHPAFPVNGYVGTYQRTIGDEYVAGFWTILSENRVCAYLCSHILAFDVQCHSGVLQITSAGAGTAHRMPEGYEYLHCVQMAVDDLGLRYQVFDEDGAVRERLTWPPSEAQHIAPLSDGWNKCGWSGSRGDSLNIVVTVRGNAVGGGARQTIIAATDNDDACPFWLGLVGRQMQLVAVLQPERGRSPHQWLGPCFANGEQFDLEILLNGQMGPGGLLWRRNGSKTWQGFMGMSAWGLERLVWPENLYVGRDHERESSTRFSGELSVSAGSSQIEN